ADRDPIAAPRWRRRCGPWAPRPDSASPRPKRRWPPRYGIAPAVPPGRGRSRPAARSLPARSLPARSSRPCGEAVGERGEAVAKGGTGGTLPAVGREDEAGPDAEDADGLGEACHPLARGQQIRLGAAIAALGQGEFGFVRRLAGECRAAGTGEP